MYMYVAMGYEYLNPDQAHCVNTLLIQISSNGLLGALIATMWADLRKGGDQAEKMKAPKLILKQ